MRILNLITICVLFSLPTIVNAVEVRKSKSGICHVENESPYFDRLKYYERFTSVHECLGDQGSTRKNDLYVPKYSRKFFGTTWADEDKDGQNTRAEVLIERSTGQIHFSDSRERIVIAGRWISPFTGNINTQADRVDIDHTIPLKWAWDHGASSWSYADRVIFANDQSNLVIVEASLNRSKGAKSPIDWLPPENQCAYIVKFTRLFKKYKLELSVTEQVDFEFKIEELCD